MSGEIRWDLRSVGAAHPAEGWREVLERAYLPFDVRPSVARIEEFDASCSRARLGALALVETTYGCGTGRRGRAEIAATTEDVLGILVMCSGRLGLNLRGHGVVLSPGQVIMWDGALPGSFSTLGTVTKSARSSCPASVCDACCPPTRRWWGVRSPPTNRRRG